MDNIIKIESKTEAKKNLSIAGSILSSLLALTCCIGPAVFLIGGAAVGFLGRLSFLEQYRPYFLAASVVLIGIAVWYTFIRKQNCSCPADRRKLAAARTLTIFGLVLLILSFFFTKIILLFAGG
jgi:mercuric ion transport protein